MDNKFDLKKFITENKNKESVNELFGIGKKKEKKEDPRLDDLLTDARNSVYRLEEFFKAQGGDESYIYYNSLKETRKIFKLIEQLDKNINSRYNAFMEKAVEYDPELKKDFGATPEFDKLFADTKEKYRMDDVD